GDELESIRQFDLDAQTSVEQLPSCTILLGQAAPRERRLRDCIREGDITVDVAAEWLEAKVSISPASVSEGVEDYSLAFFDNGLGEFEAGDFVVDEARRERFFAQLTEWRTQGWSTFVFCNNEGEIERLHDLIPAVEADALHFSEGTLGRGFTFPAGRVAVLSDSELFGRYRNTRARRLALRRS